MTTEASHVGRDSDYFKEQLALIPARYSPLAHLAATTGIGVAAIVAGVMAIDAFRWRHLAVAALFLVLSNLVEWLAHKYLLHRRQRFLEPLYDQHVPRHHRFYVDGDMAVGTRREWRFVLMPARGVLAIAALAIPLALIVGALFGHDAGWVALMTVGSYATIYEVMHLCYHLPDTHPVRGIWPTRHLIRWLSRHHARHHDPRLMRTWNFNVTVPLWDFILGTNWWGRKAKQEP